MVSENAEAAAAGHCSSPVAVYREFEDNCAEAGIARAPEALRSDHGPAPADLIDPRTWPTYWTCSAEEEEMESCPMTGLLDAYDRRGAGSVRPGDRPGVLGAEDVFSAPVYCDPAGKWNVSGTQAARWTGRSWTMTGYSLQVRSIDPQQVQLLAAGGAGRRCSPITWHPQPPGQLPGLRLLSDRRLRLRGPLANVYYGALATSALDLLWRSSLIAHMRRREAGPRGHEGGHHLLRHGPTGRPDHRGLHVNQAMPGAT